MGGKQRFCAPMALNFRKQFSFVIGGLMFDVNYRHICMRLMRDYIKNQKWILHNHIES